MNMRAKVAVVQVKELFNNEAEKTGKYQEQLEFTAVPRSQYPEDGSDEDNTFAVWSPTASFTINVANPNLWGKFEVGQKYYVDFTQAETQ